MPANWFHLPYALRVVIVLWFAMALMGLVAGFGGAMRTGGTNPCTTNAAGTNVTCTGGHQQWFAAFVQWGGSSG